MRKRALAALLCALTVLTACGCAMAAAQQAIAEEDTYELYFQVRDLDAAGGGDAIAAEHCAIRRRDGRPTAELAAAMVELLLDGPADETLKSPFPAGTGLLGVEVSGGRAVVDLSMAYSTLSGVGLTMADYCITMTLTQLSGVRTVSVTVGGQELAYRGAQSFQAKDVLFASTEDIVGTVDVTLYFLNESGGLAAEPRTLDLYEGDTQAETLVRALLEGPAKDGLYQVLPEGFSVQAVWMEEDVCCVNLSSTMLDGLPQNTNLRPALRALAKSLLSLKTVEAVRFLRDSLPADTIGGMDVSHLVEN